MKYVLIIMGGAADLPIGDLANKTPIEFAAIPNIDALAVRGRVGGAFTAPHAIQLGSDVACMSLLGYDPANYYTGRAPLEAAALGYNAGDADWIFRLNLVTTGSDGPDAGLMLDHSAGAITSQESKALVTDLLAHWRKRAPALTEGMSIIPGVSYRNILVDASGRDYRALDTTPPHSIPREHWSDYLPRGCNAAVPLRTLMDFSAAFLPTHEVNLARTEQGLRPANMAWIWGQGTRPSLPAFRDRFGIRGAMISAVDLLGGLASFIGWDRLPCAGLSSYHQSTDYAAQGQAVIDAIQKYDLVCCHVESPEEASLQGDHETKVATIEAIDRDIVGPVALALEEFGEPELDPKAQGWRILIMPDHYTLCSTRRHHEAPVPFVMSGAWVRSVVERPFSEACGCDSDLIIDPGHELMEYFLKGGLAAVRAGPPR